MTPFGEMKTVTPEGVRVQTADGKIRERIDRAELPPSVITFITAIRTTLASGMGPIGKGIDMFVFDGTGIDSCKQGKVWVLYAGERYLYEMPFPGCNP
jgi:hypothetical protein